MQLKNLFLLEKFAKQLVYSVFGFIYSCIEMPTTMLLELVSSKF